MTDNRYKQGTPEGLKGNPAFSVVRYLVWLMLIWAGLSGIQVTNSWAYPSSYGMDNSFEWITQVSLSDTSSTMVMGSGQEPGGYNYFSDFPAEATKGSVFTLSVTISPDFNDYIYAWIDWNQDNDFSETERYILASGTSSPGPHTQAITIPVTAVTGTTRMRISLKFGDAPTYNEVIEFGEVEDYDVLVQDAGPPDTTAPGRINDLNVTSVTSGSAALSWAAPGDDNQSGTATSYDVRYATFAINESNWALASTTSGEPSPQIAGSSESFTVNGLSPGTTYYFAIKAVDESANEGLLSNIAMGTTNSLSFCSGGNLVMVTGDGGFGIRYDALKRILFESWGFTVTAIADTANQSSFNNAAAVNDVMYISETVDSSNITTKARDLDIGIVVEESRVLDDMAFLSPDNYVYTVEDHIVITDNSHYITSGFSLGNLTVYTVPDAVTGNDTIWASGGQQLARTPVASPTIYVFETGDALVGGYTAANRRVSIHFFFDTDPAIWHNNLETLLQRSLEWGSCGAGVPQYSISGRAFEDVGYGGGTGRSYATASGENLSSVRIELYDASGEFINYQDTAANGNYTFTGLAPATYQLRAVNEMVVSTRTGSNGSEVAVQTFRADGANESVGTGMTKVGGEQPQSVDAPANNGSQSLATLQSPAGQYTQSLVTVDASGSNISGIDFGFNFDTIVNTNNSGQGSLRQFLLNANLLAGTQTSQFMIPTTDTGYDGSGNGEYTISPSTAFPTITDTVVLDGATQTSNMGDTNASGPEIELSGNLLPAVSGLVIISSANGSTIRGFTINQFIEDGIDIHANNTTIQGNYIGTDITGSLAKGNGDDGINVEGGDYNKIGGSNPGEGNLISANLDDGINLRDGATNNIIQGNYIGTNAAASNTIGNGDTGILIYNLSNNNYIGGTSASEANIIARNGSSGILVSGSTACTLIGNSIHSNGGLGIDLSATNVPDGVAINDPNDADSGANDLLNYPVITAATASSGTVTVDFELDLPAGSYHIDFFKNPLGADPSGHGEGQNPTDAITIVHAGGNQGFTHNFSGGIGDIITATATVDAAGDLGSTSEFSAAYTTTAVPADVRLNKSACLVSDPFNNTTHPKMIPGALVDYMVTVRNEGLGPADANTVIITNPIGNRAVLFTGDLSGGGSPVIFQDGTPASGLSFNNSQVTYSNNNGSTFDYTPAGGTQFDPAVTHIRVAPSGAFNASDGANHPNFTLQYRVRIN